MDSKSKRILSPNSVSVLKEMPASDLESPDREEQENTTRNGGGFNDIIYKIEDTPPWYYAMLLALQVRYYTVTCVYYMSYCINLQASLYLNALKTIKI